jgi:hypothetical protein
MITIIDTRTNKSYVTECYTTAGEKIGISGRAVRQWQEKKILFKQDPVTRFNNYIIYFDTQELKAKKGYAIKAEPSSPNN